MAKLSAHGDKIGQVDYVTFSFAYMSDGKILRNDGFGWKLYKHVKEGITPQQALNNRLNHQKEMNQKYPLMAEFIHKLHNVCGLSKRWKLYSAIELMSDDSDGVWSEVCDGYGDNVHASIEEINELCRLYKLATDEINEKKES